jgi:hypothetical protein
VADRGSVAVTLGVLLFGAVLMLGLAVDLARVGSSWREAAHAAGVAAEAGAGWIDEDAALDDRIVLDPGRAGAVAASLAAAPDRAVTVDAGLARICVTVGIPVRPTILLMIGAASTTVSASACAEPRKG